MVLDNPVYCGKIAYGRRVRERVKGKKDEYRTVNKQDFLLQDGKHEAIVSEEIWQAAHEKRLATGIKPQSIVGKERAHLLTGIIKCPKCGCGMYANKVSWTKKDGTYKEIYYYACGRNKLQRGHYCDYSANLKKTDIEPLVVEVIKELVQDEGFASDIKKRIGIKIAIAHRNEEKINARDMIKNLVIGIVIIFVVAMGAPLLINGLSAWVGA